MKAYEDYQELLGAKGGRISNYKFNKFVNQEEWKNLTLETQTNSENALELAKEYEKENKKLQLQNNFLVGGITISVGVCVAGVITFLVTNIK